MFHSMRRHALILFSTMIAVTYLHGGGGGLPESSHRTVVVELFTAEGCSSCPPADELLGRLRTQTFANGAEIIPLGLHVDYWNFQGWKDRFASADFTHRQEKYKQNLNLPELYTPQMVIDGSVDVTGNDAPRVLAAVSQAALRPQRAEIHMSMADGKLKINVKAEQSNAATVMLALTEDNLMTKVGAGENAGRELHHSAVVRKLQSVGELHGGNFENSVPLTFGRDWKRENMHVVVFVQDSSTGKIDGAASEAAPLP